LSDEINLRLQKLEIGHEMIVRDRTNDSKKLEESMSIISDAFIQLVEIKKDFTHFIASNDESNRHHAQRHDKQDLLLEKMNERLDQHDIILPQLQETRSWILIAIGIIVSAVIVALVALVVK